MTARFAVAAALVLLALSAAAASELASSSSSPQLYSSLQGAAYNVSYDSRALLINGQRVLLQSGSIHYPRMPPEMWAPVLAQARAHGLNMLETYVHWNWHEPVQGQIDFRSEGRDIGAFIRAAGAAGLYVNLRIGPYVCAEWTYGGFPVWLKFLEGIEFRTENEPYLAAMKSFVLALLAEVEPLLARNGGPIVMAQIENEYGNWEASYGEAGQRYVQLMADFALQQDIGVPWIMCVQPDAPQNIINTCNGFYCDQWIANHAKVNPTQPHFWTENWNGWFQHWGEPVPHRDVRDDAYGVARFIMLGGTMHNYYMFYGGTSFGRWVGGPSIITSYDYDVALNEYGLPNPLKFAQLTLLHSWLSKFAPMLLHEDTIPATMPLGPAQEATVWGPPGSQVAFLANMALTPATVSFNVSSGPAQFALPQWSVSFVDMSSGEVLYNTAHNLTADADQALLAIDDGVEASEEQQLRVTRPAVTAGDVNFLCIAEDAFGFWTEPVSSLTPMEQINFTRDSSDYLLYQTSIVLQEESAMAGRVELQLSNFGDYATFQLEMGSLTSYAELPALVTNVTNVTFPITSEWKVGYIAQLSILSSTQSLQNYGAFLETIQKGIRNDSVVQCQGVDLRAGEQQWLHQTGLQGELKNYPALASNDAAWQAHAACLSQSPRQVVWYRLQLDLALSHDPSGVYALDLGAMGKGMAWANGRALGRYWNVRGVGVPGACDACSYAGPYNPDKCRTGCGEASQRYYHVPRAWLRDGINDITLLEEKAGFNPAAVQIVRMN